MGDGKELKRLQSTLNLINRKQFTDIKLKGCLATVVEVLLCSSAAIESDETRYF